MPEIAVDQHALAALLAVARAAASLEREYDLERLADCVRRLDTVWPAWRAWPS